MSLRSHSVLASSGRETSPFSTVLHHPEAVSSDRLGFRHARASLRLAVCLTTVLLAPALRAQSCATPSATDFQAALPVWSAPLDRVVTLHARDVSLRDA